jgi:hypothetical protein
MWEYNRISIKFLVCRDLIDKLNELGSKGWEVIYYNEIQPNVLGGYYNTNIFLKRNSDGNKKSNNNI